MPIFDPGNIAFEAVNTGTLFNLTLGKFLSDFLNFFLLLNCPPPRPQGIQESGDTEVLGLTMHDIKMRGRPWFNAEDDINGTRIICKIIGKLSQLGLREAIQKIFCTLGDFLGNFLMWQYRPPRLQCQCWDGAPAYSDTFSL